ncbi:MAG: tRNA threonylcarbamoyladenosine dehydratase [Treponema sp.]|nr:tRNA threonylcarbamoyladenosine dehydratase [Treponema sp.]
MLLFGTGGVGSWCAEALVRSGIGELGLVDFDLVCESNVNRQLQAITATLGRPKVEVLKERLLEINPECRVIARQEAFTPENAGSFELGSADFVIDAIDSLEDKLALIETVHASGTRLLSSMGMARRLDPTRIKPADIWATSGCPLARRVRAGLRKRGFSGNFTVVYSDECLANLAPETDAAEAGPNGPASGGKMPNGSAVTVTATAGMILASLVLREVCG